MTLEEMEQALAHDLAQKRLPEGAPSQVVVARYCLQNAALATRGAEAALVAVQPPAVVEARQAVQLAMTSLDRALILLAQMEQSNEQRD